MEKKRVGVLFGGNSSEYSISLQSAYGVLTNLDEGKYQVTPIGITPGGDWFIYSGSYDKILDNTWREDVSDLKPVVISPKPGGGITEIGNGQSSPIEFDMILPVLHGKNGEDGTVQGMLQLTGIPVAGCDVLSSALCMDKYKAHVIVQSAGIEVPKAVTLSGPDIMKKLSQSTARLKYPIFVKPVRAGSSLGITKVFNENELMTAAATALKFDNQIIAEETIEGFEVGCAVLGNDRLTIGRVDEIELTKDFFDFTEKYVTRTSTIHMPARIDAETEKRIQTAAEVIYKALGCSGFARVDMFLTPEGRIVFNEVNTIPGMTAHSRYPKMMEGIGLSYEEVLDRLLTLCETA